jgi:hypothetical protein
MKGPEFEELIGPEVPAEERERLRRAHDALVAAGPPPDLPPTLAAAAESRATRAGRTSLILPRRRLAASLVLAAALALAAFGAGYLVAERGGDDAFATDRVLAMRGTEAAPKALASLVLGVKDDDGNWPMKMTVLGLDTMPVGGRYELVLTKAGKPAASCGTFTMLNRRTVVYLNAPYKLKQYDGWAITREGSEEILIRTATI